MLQKICRQDVIASWNSSATGDISAWYRSDTVRAIVLSVHWLLRYREYTESPVRLQEAERRQRTIAEMLRPAQPAAGPAAANPWGM